MNPLNWLQGYRTYIAAIGLLITAVLQGIDQKYVEALQSLMAALAAFGIKRSLVAQDARDGPPVPPGG